MFITLNQYHGIEKSKKEIKEIHVNIYSIRTFHRMPDDKRTRITFMGDEEYIDVKQTPSVIEYKINQILDLL